MLRLKKPEQPIAAIIYEANDMIRCLLAIIERLSLMKLTVARVKSIVLARAPVAANLARNIQQSVCDHSAVLLFKTLVVVASYCSIKLLLTFARQHLAICLQILLHLHLRGSICQPLLRISLLPLFSCSQRQH